MGFLKGFLRKAEEEIADILPGGKTGKSIRAQRKAPVAKTVSRPRDESKSWLSKDFNPVSDGINDIKSAFKYASKDWKSSENQRQVDTQNANRQILKKYTQGQLNKNQVESLVGSKVKNAGLKKKGNLYVNTVKNSTGETLLQNTGAGIMNAAPQRVIGGLAEYGGTALGNDSIRDFGTRLNQPFRDYNALAYENADNKAVAIGGNIAGNLLTLPIAPAGKAGLAYRGVVAGAPTAADTGYAIKQAGGGRVAQTIGGGATGIASGYLNSVGGDKILKPVGAVTSKLVGKTVTTKLAPTAFGRIGAGVLNEGGEEVIEQGVDNAVAKSTYDPDRKLTENLATSFLLGGAMGGVVRGGVELGNPNTRTQLINESKVKDIANDRRGILAGPLAGDFSRAKAQGKVFEGVDGKPRFEVDDSGAKLVDKPIKQEVARIPQGITAQKQALRDEMIDVAGTGDMANVQAINAKLKELDTKYPEGSKTTRTYAKDILDHQKLYKQYPELRTVEIIKKKLNGKNGYATQNSAGQPVIVLDTVTLKNDPEYAKGTLLHELQHVIQNKERFAGGSSDKNFDTYNRSAGEAEARAVSTRMNMTEGERYKNGSSIDSTELKTNGQTKVSNGNSQALLKQETVNAGGKEYDAYEISAITSTKAKTGSATKLLNDIKELANTEGKLLVLQDRASARGDYKGVPNSMKPEAPMSQSKLTKWYEKNGFKRMPMPDGSPSEVMYYLGKPSKSKPQSTFNDSLDVPKEDLIIRNDGGKAMSIDDTHRTWRELMDTTEKPLTEYKVGDKVATDTMYGQVTGKITKVPNFAEDFRIKGNGFKIKLDKPLELPNGRKSLDTITADGRHFSSGGKAMSVEPNAPVAKTDPQASLKQEARKYKSAEEFVKANAQAPMTSGKTYMSGKNKDIAAGSVIKTTLNDAEYVVQSSSPDGLMVQRKALIDAGISPDEMPSPMRINPNEVVDVPTKVSGDVRTLRDKLYDAGITSDKQLTDLYNQATKAPVESKRPTLQDALDGKSTKVVKTEPKIPKVAPKRTETAPKKPFIPDEIKAIRAKREANTSQQTRTDQTRKNQQALDSKSSVQSQPESKVAPRTGVQSISQAVQGRVNKISPQKARQGIGSKGRQGLLSGLSSKDTIQLSGVNVNDPFNNRKIGKRLKNEFGRYFVDEDAEMINLMKRIEKETGQKDLVETWLQDSDLVRNTNSIANSKIRRNENLKLALRGLSKKQQASFDEYASARTELSNLERGLESSSKPKEQLQQIVRDGNIDFGNRFIALNNYYGDWAKDLYDAGIISKSKLDDWSQNKDYVRVQRDMEDILNYTPPTGKSRSFGTTSTSKKRTGSTREILSPTNIALERGQQLQLEIQRNKAASNTIDTLEKYGLAEKVSQQYATGKNVVKRFKDGKVEYFATSKDVKRVIENVNPFQLGVLGRVISTPTRLFRSGTTALSAPFATTNYARDQISSAIYSDQALPRLSKTAQGNVEYIAGTHSPKNIVSGIASATKDYFGGSSNPLWEKFEQVAGDQTQFDEMRNTRSSKATMRELRQGGKGALINKIVNPVRSMEDLIGITEKATRFQNFKGIYEAEMKRSGNEKIATQKASQAALQNSVNFTRAGKAMRVINLLLPYSNAGIQGSRNVARSFRKRPVATTMKSVAFVAVPTVLLTLMNYDDEETAKVYKNIDDTEKDDNFIIVLKGAKQNEAGSYEGIIKIPKPQGYRELTNPLRIAAERFAGNEKSGDVSKMVRDAMSAFTGPVSIEDSGKFISSLIPQAVKPTLQAIENKDYYWDSQTVPDYMIDGTDDPTKRAYKSTSGTARIIADQLGVSPILVEKFIQDTAGSVGRYGINLTDRGLNKLGIVKDDQIGGKTITGDFKRRTTEARAIEKTNKTDGQRYYDNVEKATGELPKYLQDSWKSYNTSDKNFLGEVLFEKNGQAKKQAKAAAYIEHPELFEVDKKLDKLNRKKGETGNPLYDLSYNQALIVVQEKALPPGAKDEGLNALYDQQWYSQYKNKEEKYYDKIFGKGGIEENKDNPYPERSPDLISAMDSYYDLPSSYAKGAWKKANPGIASQMEAYYSAKDAWTNTERAKLGLPPIEDRYAKYESSSGKSGSSGGSRGRSRRGSSGGSSGSRKGKFDYKFGAFAPSEIGSKKSLRKILEEAQL